MSDVRRERMGQGGAGYSDTMSAIRVITTPERIRQQYLLLIRSASREILLVLPTINSIQREKSIGVLDELKNAVRRGVRIRMLSAEDDFIKENLDNLRATGIVIRRIETPTETKFKMLIVDRGASFVVETKDDSKSNFTDAVGLATYSNSKATILPFVTIFESFWRETDLYEKAREADRVKDEFVNIAAHELRNPITPIMCAAEMIRDTVSTVRGRIDEETYRGLVTSSNIIIRSAARLHRLSEDILQVSRIEAGTFKLTMKIVDLGLLIRSVMEDVEVRYSGQKHGVELVFDAASPSNRPDMKSNKDDVGQGPVAYCDEEKVSRLLFNILDNAMKFTDEGVIRVVCSLSSQEKEAIISVRDSGSGIDPAIRPLLFEKFSAKSQGGTGIGLFLSKKIAEAHNGRIWAEDNRDGKGTTFSFSLPLDNYPGGSPV
ncbi:MAG: ATP-binding protein [Thaumarchaeota archaeon]|nr:ATP-binding protein [Nitrososphaerota archaeon]